MPRSDALGEIRPDILYRYDRIKEAAGLGDHAMRQAKRRGLKIIALHGRQFIFGRDFIEYALSPSNGNGHSESVTPQQ